MSKDLRISVHHRHPARVSAAPLKRGAACLNCRFYKIKCDGQRPHCTPCLTHPKDDPCEYQDGPRSRSKALEDKIAVLESRIYELENPDQTPSMTLSQPYQTSSTASPLGLDVLKRSDSPQPELKDLLTPNSPAGSAALHSSPSAVQLQLDTSPIDGELTQSTIQALLDHFIPRSAEVGFFLRKQTFITAALNTSAGIGSPTRPLGSLLYAVYLWADHFRQFHDPAQTRTFEARALRYVATDLVTPNTHPNRTLQLLQANILLAHYYATLSKLAEASYFVSGATTLALSAGLNMTVDKVHDTLAYGERIDGFWSVVFLSRIVSVLVRTRGIGSLCGILEVAGSNGDVPWPLDEEQYSQGQFPEPSARQTVASFIHGQASPQDGGSAIRVLETKASLLLNEAVLFLARWEVEDHSPLIETYSRLTSLYAHLHSANKRLHYLDNLDRLGPRFFTALSMLEASGLILYNAFAGSDPSYRSATLKAAVSILHPGSYNVLGASYVSPIMGFIWDSAVSALEDERHRMLTTGQSDFDEHTLQQYIERGKEFLQHHAITCPIIRDFAVASKRRSSSVTSPVSPVDIFMSQHSATFHPTRRSQSATPDIAYGTTFPTTPIEISGIFSPKNPSPSSSIGEGGSDWSSTGASGGGSAYGHHFTFNGHPPQPALGIF